MKGIIKTFIVVFYTIVLIIPQILLVLIPFWKNKPYWIIPRLWHRISCMVIGLKIIKTGRDIGLAQKKAGVIYTSNHVSYLDILVHGRWLKGLFVAKSDIASWPIFGFLAKLQGTFFVERRPQAIKVQKEKLEYYLLHGTRLMMFPEGTTTDGWEVKPFKTSLFGAALSDEISQRRDVFVQPVSITYTRINNKKVDRTSSDIVAWHGDMELLPHVWELFKHKKIICHIHFHDALHIKDFGTDRKALAYQCEIAVREKVEEFLKI